MKLIIDFTPEEKAKVERQAQAYGLLIKDYAKNVVMAASADQINFPLLRGVKPEQRAKTFIEFQSWLRENAPVSPAIPLEELGREAMYADRGLIDADE